MSKNGLVCKEPFYLPSVKILHQLLLCSNPVSNVYKHLLRHRYGVLSSNHHITVFQRIEFILRKLLLRQSVCLLFQVIEINHCRRRHSRHTPAVTRQADAHAGKHAWSQHLPSVIKVDTHLHGLALAVEHTIYLATKHHVRNDMLTIINKKYLFIVFMSAKLRLINKAMKDKQLEGFNVTLEISNTRFAA